MGYADPHRINADLHSHSHMSDGVLTPAALVERAVANGVQMLALTDHDEVSGLAAAQARADELELRFICGVEISITFAQKTVHIVGLNIDPSNAVLLKGLSATRGGRAVRAQTMAQGLAQHLSKDAAASAALSHPDLPLSGTQLGDAIYAGALRYVGNPDLISRTHLARYLVERKLCKQLSDVFLRYLTPNKPGYVETSWASLTEAVSWIRQAGGQAVIAHPGRYRFNETERIALYEAFKDLGGEGLEVMTASHTREQYTEFAKVAKQYGFLASRGSDFHGPEESRVDVGETALLPLLPDSVVPIWHNW